jgi:tocopherol cyclase
MSNSIDLLKTPHSGYHWDGSSDRFFEGWYYRVTIPELEKSFAFMYSLDDPIGDRPQSGGAAQILTSDDEYLCRTFPNVKKFWATKNDLRLGHWGKNNFKLQPQFLEPSIFKNAIEQGYQITATINQGSIRDSGNGNYCKWLYQIEPIYRWGNPKRSQQATAGLLSYLPIFEPGWQVLMAHGLATGAIDWNGKIYEFTNAPAYSEKNWGRSFPQKWFWINCNSFSNVSDLALTAVAGKRQVLWWMESPGLIGLHYQNKFYEFVPWNSQISWQIQPWGEWKMQAYNSKYYVEILGLTEDGGSLVRVPTKNGLAFRCRDTMKGKLSIELREDTGKTIVKAYSSLAGLEIGGASWEDGWRSHERG